MKEVIKGYILGLIMGAAIMAVILLSRSIEVF